MIVKKIKNKLRAAYREFERVIVRLFFSYGTQELIGGLRKLGIAPGDSVMLHSAFEQRRGFRGSIDELITVFLEAVGKNGNLLMVSMPYRSSSLQYMSKRKAFDVGRTPSAAGLVSEFFRRRSGVVRSLNPSHPILACGPRADWFVSGHEQCLYPCGPGSPFDKLLQSGGKVAFFNVTFDVFTFFHFLEHSIQAQLAFPLYHPEIFDVSVIDRNGQRHSVKTAVFSRETIARRRFEVLDAWLNRHKLIKRVRVGSSVLLMVELRAVVAAVEQMTKQGLYFHDRSIGAGA